MGGKPEPLTLEQELANLEEECRKVSLAISNSRTIRETVEASEIEVPHHLQAIARSKVPSLGRIAKVRELKVEDIVREQLMGLTQEYSEIVATREFDRMKAGDWHVLRSNFPDLYAKAFREANLILERKRKTRK
jgi:hypothetical protein